MAGEVEEDDLFFASLLALVGLADGGGDGMGALWGRDDALGTGEEHTGLEGLKLWDIHTMHQTVLDELGDNHAGPMIAQTAGMVKIILI